MYSWYSSILDCAISLGRTLLRLMERYLQARHAIVAFLVMGSLIREPDTYEKPQRQFMSIPAVAALSSVRRAYMRF